LTKNGSSTNGASIGAASGFVPSTSRSHASVGATAYSPNLSSPHNSPRTPAWDASNLKTSLDESVAAANNNNNNSGQQSTPSTPGTSQSQIFKGGSNRSALPGDNGRNTFKSVFGGFVNSMSGEQATCLLLADLRSILTHLFLPPADVFSQQKKMEISTPYDPVHLTHVGFNSDTGEFTVSVVCLDWSILLQVIC
jgi:p21-activated kinase 1